MISVCGFNNCCQLLPNLYNKSVVKPSFKFEIGADYNSIISFSSYSSHTVYILKEGQIRAIGDNCQGQIIGLLPKKMLKDYTPFEIKSRDGSSWIPISAVCGLFYTLYLVSDTKNDGKTCLALSSHKIESEYPLFLNIGEVNPISLFGGEENACAIDSKGSIIFVSDNFTSTEIIEATALPFGEKAVCVACCNYFVAALSSIGNVYLSNINNGKLLFSEINELNGNKIVFINGVTNHCFAVSEIGKVFVRECRSSSFSCLCLGKEKHRADVFTEVVLLNKYKIKAAYAGYNHSFFQTFEGKFLTCGDNGFSQLCIKEKKIPKTYDPIETSITGDVSFCIAGQYSTITFIGDFPNIPNKVIKMGKESSLINHDRKNDENAELLKKCLEENEKLRAENERLKNENASMRALHETVQIKNPTIKIIDQKSVDELKQVEIIGKGDQSEVIKVAEKFFALKIMSKEDFFIDESNLPIENFRHFFQEYEILNALHHKNIIQIFGFCFGDKNNSPSLLLEYCPYNLNNIVKELSDTERVTSIFELSLVMREVHAANIIHRNLKPENILFDEFKHVKLGDFGTSCINDVTAETQSKTACIGSLKFMAPEVLNESMHYNEKIDVYSFGVVVYFILTNGNYPKISITDILNGKKAIIPKNINELSRNLINNCWSIDPSKRPSFTDIVELIKNNKFKLIDGVEAKYSEICEFLSLNEMN